LTEYRVTLRPETRPGVPEIIRVRRALKTLLRCYSLRCIDIKEINATDKRSDTEPDAKTTTDECRDGCATARMDQASIADEKAVA
jgi:hypothetical protein